MKWMLIRLRHTRLSKRPLQVNGHLITYTVSRNPPPLILQCQVLLRCGNFADLLWESEVEQPDTAVVICCYSFFSFYIFLYDTHHCKIRFPCSTTQRYHIFWSWYVSQCSLYDGWFSRNVTFSNLSLMSENHYKAENDKLGGNNSVWGVIDDLL